MRYFQTSNASRQYYFGGLAVSFEPIDQIGGSWLGVLEVGDESTSSIIQAGLAGNPQVSEISKEEYDALKKKPLIPSGSSHQLPEQSPAPPARAALVGNGVELATGSEPNAPVPVAEPPVPGGEGVTLETRVVDIPDELRLEQGAKTLRR